MIIQNVERVSAIRIQIISQDFWGERDYILLGEKGTFWWRNWQTKSRINDHNLDMCTKHADKKGNVNKAGLGLGLLQQITVDLRPYTIEIYCHSSGD